MEYVCLIHFDPKTVFDQSPAANAVLAEVGPYDRRLEANGQLVTGRALTLPNDAKTVRVRDGKVVVTDGPFTESKEVVGGFLLIEARDVDDALEIAAGIPFAKLGAIEVRPVVDFSQPRPKL